MSEDIYQEFILELYKNPVNFGKMEKPDLHAHSFNAVCGDKIEMFIRLEARSSKLEVSGNKQDHELKIQNPRLETQDNRKIADVTFTGTGCAISQASASLLTEEIKGKTPEEIKKMDKEDIMKMLKIDLSKNPSRLKCALLSLEVVKKACNSRMETS